MTNRPRGFPAVEFPRIVFCPGLLLCLSSTKRIGEGVVSVLEYNVNMSNRDGEWKILPAFMAVFLAFYFLPDGWDRLDRAVMEALFLAKSYAREHVLLCLVPAFFIAGAIAVFLSRAAVMKYLGPRASKVMAYSVASVSGSILAVCSCTVLPLFAGIYRMGAGLGPATAFLYAGPAINVLALILTARVLGMEIGVARALGAVLFSIVIGLVMHFMFRREENAKAEAELVMPESEAVRPLWKNALFFAGLTAILVFANWAEPGDTSGLWHTVFSLKWFLAGAAGLALAVMLVRWFGAGFWEVALSACGVVLLALVFPATPAIPFVAGTIALALITGRGGSETREWLGQSWGFAKQILPLLLLGVLISGALLGRPGHEGLIPAEWIARAVGGNSLSANFFAAFAGALMYFATLTEVPILQGLMGSGMGKGPALALLLAGPALSLPNMLVIHSVLRIKKTVAFVALVVAMATLSGLIYGGL